MSKRQKSNDSKQPSQPISPQTVNSSDLSAEAARIDAAASEVSESQSPVDQALISETPGQEEPKKRGRPKGSGTKTATKASKKDQEAAEKAQTQAFMQNALTGLVTHTVGLAKAGGWTSPASPPMVSEEDWCGSVAMCINAVIDKYLPDAFVNYKEEAALLLLVAPWVTQNIMRMSKNARKNRSNNGLDGKRENNEAVRTDPVSPAPNPN